MRSHETRITALVVIAVCTVVGAAYWPTVRLDHDPLMLARAAGVIVGSGLCVGLGAFALRRDWLLYRDSLLKQVQLLVMADPAQAALPADSAVQPVADSLRTYVTDLQTQVDQLKMQRKDLEIQNRLADVQRRQTETMLHGISDAVLVTNQFNEIVLVNPAAAELFHFDISAAPRKPVTELVTDAKLAQEICEMRTAHRRTNRRTTEFQLESNGQPHCFSVTLSCVMDNRDELSAVVTVLHDVTREKEVSKMKSDFVSHVSHELRTPLSSIKAYAEMLVDGEANDDKTRQEFYHIIQGESERLSRLIDNILNISRIEAGVSRVVRKPMALTGILKDVLEVAKPSAKEKQITLDGQLAPVFFQVEIDRDMIYQATLNLISNAIKYTPANGTVTVRTVVDDEHHQVTVDVVDTGVGIPPEAMKHLFEKFYRVEQNKGMAKGSGLGLNLTRQIIESVHKGKVHVHSEVGRGSTFGFTLPTVE